MLSMQQYDELQPEVRALVQEYGDIAHMVFEKRKCNWRSIEENVSHARFYLESERKFIQNKAANDALGTCNW